MNLFSEIYGVYFRITGEILKRGSVTEKEIYDIIYENGFRDTVLFLPDKLMPEKNADYGLLRKNPDGSYSSVLKNLPVRVMSGLQKSWLRSVICDPKAGLFLDDNELSDLNSRLCDTEPLYRNEHFRYTDVFNDGDDFTCNSYRENFRKILCALKNRESIHIVYKNNGGKQLVGDYIPVRIQYSPKNDRFRLLCFRIADSKVSDSTIINIGRIISAEPLGKYGDGDDDAEGLFRNMKCDTPVTVCISTERNGVERFMMEFASYEKHSEFDLSTGSCTVKLWYDKQDETELLIRLLSFGPVLKILSPDDFRNKAMERIRRQYEIYAE